jgi:hypothetical protein
MRWTWPVTVVVLVGCTDRDPRPVTEVQHVTGDRRTLIVSVGSCNGDPSVTASETADRVALSATGGDTSDDCLDGAEVTLDEPLGDRVVIDAMTGDQVPILAD